MNAPGTTPTVAAETASVSRVLARLAPSFSRNVVSYWGLLLLNVAYTLVITPTIIGALDTELYGIWSLLNSLLAYSELLYFGLGAALVKRVAEYRATGNQAGLDRVASVVFSIYATLGIACFAASVFFSPLIPTVFLRGLAVSSATDTVIACMLMGFRVLLIFMASLFSGVLVGEDRTDLCNVVSAAFTILRFVAVCVLVFGPHPLVRLAAIMTVGTALETFALWQFSSQTAGGVSIRPAMPARTELRHLYEFGLPSFLILVSVRLINYTDTAVVGFWLGASAVAVYSLPLQLIEYARIAIKGIAIALLPRLTMLTVRNNHRELQRVFLRTIRLSGLLSAFIGVNFVFLGGYFLSVWVGASFGTPVQWVIVCLAAASYLQTISTDVALPFYQATTLFRIPVTTLLLEGVLNFTLSMIWVRWWGINGVALATLLPTAFLTFAILPRFLSAKLSIPFRTLVTKGILPSVAVILALSATHVACALVLGAPSSYLGLVIRVIATLPVLAAVFALCFPADDHALALEMAASWLPAPSSSHGQQGVIDDAILRSVFGSSAGKFYVAGVMDISGRSALAKIGEWLLLPARLALLAQVVGRGDGDELHCFAVYPSLSHPRIVYELNTSAGVYTERRLLPQSARWSPLRRILRWWAGCDPAAGAVVVLASRR